MNTFVHYLHDVSNCKCKTLCLGKKFVVELFPIRPNLYHKVTGTPIDPFYNDDNIPEFLIFLMDNWDFVDYSYFTQNTTFFPK